jgi:molecular chaperone DnaK (HSP70)
MSRASIAFGIDLGTTFSAIACAFGTVPEVYEEPVKKQKAIPSYVQFQAGGRHTTGFTALRAQRANPKTTVYDAKRLFGAKFSDPGFQAIQKDFPFRTVAGPNDSVLIEVAPGGETKQLKPYEVSSLLLKSLVDMANTHHPIPTNRVVVTVPADFTSIQRDETVKAATGAGLEVLRLINEPTAAAIAFAHLTKFTGTKTVLAFDFGGGTLDISIVELTSSSARVICTAGDSHLGGRDLDARMVDFCLDQIQRDHQLDLRRDPRNVLLLKEQCEEMKCCLSETDSFDLEVPGVINGQYWNFTITRDLFERECSTVFDRALLPVDDVLMKSGLTADQITDVLLVGGSSHIPLMKRKLEEYFHKTPYSPVNAQDAVALGAAFIARELVQSDDSSEAPFTTSLDLGPPQAQPSVPQRQFVCQELASHAISVQARNGEVVLLVRKGDPLPVSGTVIGNITIKERQRNDIRVPLFQADSADLDDSVSMGSLVIGNPFVPDIGLHCDYTWELTITLDSSGCLGYSAIVYSYDDSSGPKYPKQVRHEPPAPVQALTSTCPRFVYRALVTEARIFVDQLESDTMARLLAGKMFNAVRRYLTDEGYRIENEVQITPSNAKEFRDRLWPYLKMIIVTLGVKVPKWLEGYDMSLSEPEVIEFRSRWQGALPIPGSFRRW